MKSKLFIPVILCSLVLTACGSDSSETIAYNAKGIYDSFSDDYSYETSYETAEAEESPAEADNADDSAVSADTIKKEMLVYSCNMDVDVLNFDEAVDSFKKSLDGYGGFVENESYSDGGSNGKYYYADEEKWQTYSATVRVPSADYDAFCDYAASLGDLRSKNASVENVSSEYYDLNTTLEIYEAKEQRYIDLLADITDDEYAVSVEKELTELQVQIAQIKTRMNQIRTDVAYSYVYISINEVRVYTPEPVKKDTFFQRLSNTLSDAGTGFLSFLEGLLFVLIYLFPYLVLIGIIIAIIVAIRKKTKARRAKKAAKAAAAAVQVTYPQKYYGAAPEQDTPAQEPITPQENIPSDNKTDEPSENE
ncbi:MAG: DUF4349 domain-containing protein [Oscillospiraceae bacterium]